MRRDPRNVRRFSPFDPRLGLTSVGTAKPRPRRETMELFCCQSCGELIGVYEPLVACNGSGAHTTSRAAEPELRASAAAYYHRDCYAFSEEPERQTASGG
jgi:hypothetical protein